MTEYNNTVSIDKEQPEKFFGHFHLIFTTYGMMRNNIDILCSYCFEYIVLDESQNIKIANRSPSGQPFDYKVNTGLYLLALPSKTH